VLEVLTLPRTALGTLGAKASPQGVHRESTGQVQKQTATGQVQKQTAAYLGWLHCDPR
jgi:hypothetical protein